MIRGSVLLMIVALVGCAPTGRPPVLDRSQVLEGRAAHYQVKAGDTLYSIAWRYELDYRALARANGIRAPYTIYVGQRLRLTEAAVPAAPASAPLKPGVPPSTRPSPPARSAPSATATPLTWRPPTTARIQRGFGGGSKGFDYQLGATDRVSAAGTGTVVYAGSGLGGFRHLVIIKHDPLHLSAYSFDRALAVREGQEIAAGEPIALASGADRAARLHFEIRRNGQPVDPGLLMGR
jgi:lipoprotein NlpD